MPYIHTNEELKWFRVDYVHTKMVNRSPLYHIYKESSLMIDSLTWSLSVSQSKSILIIDTFFKVFYSQISEFEKFVSKAHALLFTVEEKSRTPLEYI